MRLHLWHKPLHSRHWRGQATAAHGLIPCPCPMPCPPVTPFDPELLPEALRGRTEGLAVVLDLELVGTERVAMVPLGDTPRCSWPAAGRTPRSAGGFCPPNVRCAAMALRHGGGCRRWPPPPRPTWPRASGCALRYG